MRKSPSNNTNKGTHQRLDISTKIPTAPAKFRKQHTGQTAKSVPQCMTPTCPPFVGQEKRFQIKNAHGRLENHWAGNGVRLRLCAKVRHEGGTFLLCSWCLLPLMLLHARAASAALFERRIARKAHAMCACVPTRADLSVQVNRSIRHQLLLDSCFGCPSCGGSAWQRAKIQPTMTPVALIRNCCTQAWKPDGALLGCDTKQSE